MSTVVGETLVEGDKSSIVLYLFSSPACSLHKLHTAPAEPVLKCTRALNVGCRCCFMGHLHMPNKSFWGNMESVEMLLLLLYVSFFLLLVAQFSLNASRFSTDRPVCWLQIIIII